MGNIELLNCDCMDYMKNVPDKYFDLAIVDPPYGIGMDGTHFMASTSATKGKNYGNKNWDSSIPTEDYFIILERISKNRIIWGFNYFPQYFGCGINVWDKDNGESIHSDCELAYNSQIKSIRKFRFKWQGMLQENMKYKEYRIHPTQKPVQLYMWLLKNYAKPDFKIIDTHLGSGSSAIAAYDFGCDFVGTEIDLDYYTAAVKRFEIHKMQQKLF
jgi:site-specific DNA-methyltransferase (adenine-specific)